MRAHAAVVLATLALAACGGGERRVGSTGRSPEEARADLVARRAAVRDRVQLKIRVACGGGSPRLGECPADTCAACRRARAFVERAIALGEPQEEIVESYRNRFEGEPVVFPLDAAESRGPDGAALTIVELADLTAPGFRATRAELEAAIAKRAGDVRFVSLVAARWSSPSSLLAARAALAASRQERYWDMRAALASSPPPADEGAVIAHARTLGLDEARFTADLRSAEVSTRLEQVTSIPERLRLRGSPMVFVNGRRFDAAQDLDVWLDTELELARAQDE